MRLLLDECVDHRFGRELVGHEVFTVAQMGWTGIKNGELLKRAQEAFGVFITVDRNLAFQQNLPVFRISVLILTAKTNRLIDLKPLIPSVLAALRETKRGEVKLISG